jgi:hypothetical protein
LITGNDLRKSWTVYITVNKNASRTTPRARSLPARAIGTPRYHPRFKEEDNDKIAEFIYLCATTLTKKRRTPRLCEALCAKYPL